MRSTVPCYHVIFQSLCRLCGLRGCNAHTALCTAWHVSTCRSARRRLSPPPTAGAELANKIFIFRLLSQRKHATNMQTCWTTQWNRQLPNNYSGWGIRRGGTPAYAPASASPGTRDCRARGRPELQHSQDVAAPLQAARRFQQIRQDLLTWTGSIGGPTHLQYCSRWQRAHRCRPNARWPHPSHV
jgi:hypothetical protein